jgi:hypothetical protein
VLGAKYDREGNLKTLICLSLLFGTCEHHQQICTPRLYSPGARCQVGCQRPRSRPP